MATGQVAPLPPEVAAQASPEVAQSVFAQQGVDKPQPGMQLVQQVGEQLKKLEAWINETKDLVKQLNPNFQAYLAPMADAAIQLGQAVAKEAQQSGMQRGSPVTQPQPTPNPAAGPPNPNVV